MSVDTASSMQYAKGWVGARWSARDENDDALLYAVHIRGTGEREWKVLREKVRTKYVSWDSTAFPDGEYVLRVTASDLPGNSPEAALTSQLESEPLRIDNTPPRITGLAATRKSRALEVSWKTADALSNIARAEYSLDGGDWTVILPVTGISDARELDYTLTLDDVAPGEHTVAVRVRDIFDNVSTEKAVVR
jgi:hypothetical protein